MASAEYVPLASPIAVAVSSDLVGGMPRAGNTFGVMSSGDATILTQGDISTGSSTDLGTGPVRGNSAYDVTVLRLDLNVPSGSNCLSFDFRFLSEEYPEYVGSPFNDAFLAEVLVAELGDSTWSTSGSAISAPDNFAFDPEGNPVTINAAGVTSMTSGEAVGTTYDGATPLLVASTPVTSGHHPLYLSIFDQGDHVLDSSVLLDNLRTYATASAGDCRPGAALAGNRTPVWDDFHAGDVHVHAAGDTNLKIHPRCDGYSEAECAQYMVQNVLDRAKRFDAEWLVFTEHGPWLGFDRDEDLFLYDETQARNEWYAVKQALDDQSSTTIRGLMGEELGTAIPACTDVDVDLGVKTKVVPYPPFVIAYPTVEKFELKSPGHYGVYSTPDFINDSMMDCNETGSNGYADDAAAMGAWGGMNHPDNKDGGSPWHCFSTETHDGSLRGREEQPQLGRSDRCPLGLDQYGVTSAADSNSFRTVELINANNLPSAKTLGIWDMYLQNGYKVSAVGGGDGHTAPRKQDLAGAAKCLVKLGAGVGGIPTGTTVGDCVDEGSAPSDGNHNKVAGTGRTIAYYPSADAVVGAGYDSTNPADPARESIRNGSTLATNGPVATAQMNGQFPGSLVSLPGTDPVELRVDWQSGWRTVGDTIKDDRSTVEDEEFDIIPGPGEMSTTLVGRTPKRVVVVTADTDGCGWDRDHCAASTHRRVIDIANGQTSASGVTLAPDHADVLVDPPADGYVRVELYWDEPEGGTASSDSRYRAGKDYDFAAFTSPIYTERPQTMTIDGTVVDGPTGDPVSGAEVELCRTSGTAVCVTRTTRPDGTFQPVVSPAGTWTARAFPPAGTTNRGVALLSLGTVAPDEHRNITLTLPEFTPQFIDPSGTVVDTDGNPLPGATVTLLSGPSSDGPFTPVADGAAVMSPSNRTNPMVAASDGTYGWDVLAGWYAVEATSPGCTATDGSAAASSGPLQVPPPALDVTLVLDCRPPDDTAPVITVDGAPSGYTANRDLSVTVTVSDSSPAAAMCLLDGGPAVDAEGGIDGELPPCADVYLATGLSDGPHTLTVVAADDHDNIAVEERAFTVDTAAPAIAVQGVVEGQTYPATAPPTASCTATDSGSGLAGPCTGVVTSPSGGIGQWSYTATATDLVGNKATKTVTWQVGALFQFSGFFEPVPQAPEVLKAKAGSAIPVKFSLHGPQGLGVVAAGYPKATTVSCDTDAELVPLTETATPGASGLAYDPASDTYTYVWKTVATWKNTCRQFSLKLTDGTVHKFTVSLR